MKVIIAGSRNINNQKLIEDAINESGFEITQVISGGCRGVDKGGEFWAANNNIPCRIISANWDQFGKSAGFIRNENMSNIAEALIALWEIDENGNGSKGTRNMINIARNKNLKVFVKEIRKNKQIDELPLFKNDKIG